MNPDSSSNPSAAVTIAALYHFAPVAEPSALRDQLAAFCEQQALKGTLLLAGEGINGTVAGSAEGIEQLLAYVRTWSGFEQLEAKCTWAAEPPFHRMKVKLKREIVTMGVPGVDPRHLVGSYLDAAEWNALLKDPEVLVIDTRNDYEVAIGTFQRAVSPNTRSFREFPAYVQAELAGQKQRKIAMFCTGGIRCEKASSYLKANDFAEVYHLRGGILKYLETVPPSENLWQGECFVFDERVSVDKDLKPGAHQLCRACRRPLRDGDRKSLQFEEGVSCPQCFGERSDAQRAAARQRERQVRLAAERGEKHIGVPFVREGEGD